MDMLIKKDEALLTGVFCDYKDILKLYSVPFSCENDYLTVIRSAVNEGWSLHISIVKIEMVDFLHRLIPFLENLQLTYVLPENSNVHTWILDGSYGYQNVGKVITIFPPVTGIGQLAEELIAIANSFKGPVIPSAIPLKGNVYATSAAAFPVKKVYDKNNWPFKAITARNKVPTQSRWLKRKYLIVQVLKSDVKGNVYKAFKLDNPFAITWCVIKEGKQYQCADRYGRDIKDRIIWQYKCHKELSNLVSLPRPLELFEINGNIYFVMEFIDGPSFNDAISEIQEGIIWHDLTAEKQVRLIDILLKLLQAVENLHMHGFVHRDLNPVNFIIDKSSRPVAIDIELAYDIQNQLPSPAFAQGTPGFMSPNQVRLGTPVYGDDIFGLGGLLIRTLTGLSPLKFATDNETTLFDRLNFFVRNRRLAHIITCSRDASEQQRPSLISIRHNLELYHSQIITNKHREEGKNAGIDFGAIILNGIKKLLNAAAGESAVWLSRSAGQERQVSNPLKLRSWYPGTYSGNAGILYFLIKAESLGYKVDGQDEIIFKNFDYLQVYYAGAEAQEPGLYTGAAGFGLLMANMIKLGFLEKSITNYNRIKELLRLPNSKLNLFDGIAGQGMAMIKCAEFLSFPALLAELPGLINRLINEQNKDGSWHLRTEDSNSRVKVVGLFHGVAGILYFLLHAAQILNWCRTEDAIQRGLAWLHNQSNRSADDRLSWRISSTVQGEDPWIENGFTGIALLFIKAYEISPDERYMDIVYQTLSRHPREITSNYLSQATGISGLGEAYMEAYRVFGEEEWLERAKRVFTFLANISCEDSTGTYWLDGNEAEPSHDLIIGNAGILHAFLRYQCPSKISLPIL